MTLPAPPQVPSGTSSVKTHTRSSGLGQAPRSASATASVIPAVTAARRSSLYWPSGTWHMKRYRGDFGGAPATYTSGRWMHTHARCRPTSLLASTLLEQQVGDLGYKLALGLAR